MNIDSPSDEEYFDRIKNFLSILHSGNADQILE